MRTFEEQLIQDLVGLIPDNTGITVKKLVEEAIKTKLNNFEEEVKRIFCKEHDLCQICIKGGYYCQSDHK